MEHYLGRKLMDDEIVHHIDGDKGNNSIDNLVILSRSEHINTHRSEIEAARKKCIKWHIDRALLAELYVNQGKSLTSTSRAMGIPKSTIAWYVRKNGIKHKEGLCSVNRWH